VAQFISANGTIEQVEKPTLEQMQAFVGGDLDYSILPGGKTVVLARDYSYGSELPVNHTAMNILQGQVLFTLQGNVIWATTAEC